MTGLRIDHPDGLWDPAGYFRDLQRAAWMALARAPHPRPLAPLDGEKGERSPSGSPLLSPTGERWGWGRGSMTGPPSIPSWPTRGPGRRMMVSRWPSVFPSTWSWRRSWSRGSRCPNDWAVHGTVGYEFARVTTGLFVDPAHQRAFDDLYARITREGRRRPFSAAAYEAKELMLRTALASETNVLARALNRISEQNRRTRDFTLSALRNALREVITAFPVYRTYITCESLRLPEPRPTPDFRPGPAGDRAGGGAGQAAQPGLRPVCFRFPG